MTLLLRLLLIASLAAPLPLRADPAAQLSTALDLLRKEQWQEALAAAPEGLGRDFVLWSWLRDGEGRLGDYEDFLKRRPDWPGLALLRRKGEEAVTRSRTPARVVAYFAGNPPRTGAGAVALVSAYRALGQPSMAETEAMRAWAELSLSAEEEASLQLLMPEAVAMVHELRLETLLWEGRRAEALRMLPRVPEGRRKLAEARLALRSDQPGVDRLIEAIPAALQSDPGLAYERFTWRMRRDLYPEAATLILATAPDQLGRAGDWAPRRALLARWLLRQDRAQDAYRVASRHGLSAGSAYADLEFLAGFIALRRLNDPETALRHFGHLRQGVSTAISVARADYWQGRAEEAAGRKAQAEAHYRTAARHQTAYYGLLAAEKLGLELDPALLDDRQAQGWEQSRFASSSVLQMARLLLAADNRAEGKRFLLHLAESLDTSEIAQLAEMALQMDQTHIALVLSKQAAERGAILTRSYYPLTRLVPEGLRVSRALALAIARRESEFEPIARSSANARGLMQVLPETAERMAKDIGLTYSLSKLYDPGFNAQVGSAYLAKLVEEFGPSIALVASGYNAGPGRPRRWITEFGDPRRPDVDVIDWVESIPFAETRTYVMRVVEGVVIYRAKLRGSPGPVRVTAELKG
ncbi:lytic transglycosylase domain-containing protein [Pseudogemmobacter faecipullorum]|uniref:Lytic transglycosylase domain-containing protein n=1 Tax=Pseudogemmobacter faecipullorum TaxID=2755041 RepID=A0ABS8CRH8_9RHOB|nr:lytic transglycosylase domain-containing protein [Pseudogemmobacter faecipullorum]MCB5411425.1 lytic transglycosylase domain-containing protein [Pseudogemmobacter faecipullorum]